MFPIPAVSRFSCVFPCLAPFVDESIALHPSVVVQLAGSPPITGPPQRLHDQELGRRRIWMHGVLDQGLKAVIE